MVDYLLSIGADPNEDCLVAAVTRSSTLMLVLLEAKLQHYQRLSSEFGAHALRWAIILSNTTMILVLLSKRVNLNHIVKPRAGECNGSIHPFDLSSNESALGTAIRLYRDEDLRIVKMLLDSGADPNRTVHEDPTKTALLAAIRKGNLKLVETLIAAGADVHREADRDISRTTLQLAVEQGNVRIIDVLLKHKANINAGPCDRNDATALQLAAMNGSIGIASVLLERGAHVDAPAAK